MMMRFIYEINRDFVMVFSKSCKRKEKTMLDNKKILAVFIALVMACGTGYAMDNKPENETFETSGEEIDGENQEETESFSLEELFLPLDKKFALNLIAETGEKKEEVSDFPILTKFREENNGLVDSVLSFIVNSKKTIQKLNSQIERLNSEILKNKSINSELTKVKNKAKKLEKTENGMMDYLKKKGPAKLSGSNVKEKVICLVGLYDELSQEYKMLFSKAKRLSHDYSSLSAKINKMRCETTSV